ncbi:MAG: amino acid adenylation domain-containing protein [Bacteroidetes bacterium]|nr:amino acid adenylation domain-containing protein [Bacteroidota bacterium]
MLQKKENEVSVTETSALSILYGEKRDELIKQESLVAVFKNTVQAYPQKAALIFNDKISTYSELDFLSDYYAAHLVRLGIKAGDFVGVYLSRGIELHVAVLAVVKAGAAYVPLDYDTPFERVHEVLNEVEAKACFTDKDLAIHLHKIQVHIHVKENTNSVALPKVNPGDTAYVIYTSGSTGKPKGIPITHQQICHLIRAEQSVLGIEANDNVYQGFSVSFDMWCEETWISYLVGATLWVADVVTAKSINDLPSVLEKNNITVLHAVPSLLSAMPRDATTVRIVNAGGETCTPLALQKWTQRKRKFINSYGPTETTVSASMASLTKGSAITIGTLLPNYSIAVVDENLQALPIGQEGELIISGIGVSKGYIKRPELNAQKFLKKPASLQTLYGTCIYRTGDLVKISSEKNIEFLGRIDDQIKLHGYRIELGDIESRLLSISGVKEAAVKLIKEETKKDWLAAFVCMYNHIPLNKNLLRQELAQALPPYMLPQDFIEVQEIPRLPSGKINRKQLLIPENYTQKEETHQESYEHIQETKNKIYAILKNIFPNKNIKNTDDFFNEIGGDSFTCALFVSAVRDKVGIESASFKDVYTIRPLEKLLVHWENEKKEPIEIKNEIKKTLPYTRFSHALCSIAQTITLPFIYFLFAIQFFLPFMAYSYAFVNTRNHLYGIIVAFISFCFLMPLFNLISVLVKWVVLGKIKEGDYPLWGLYYFRWWLVQNFQKLNSVQFLADTPLYPVYLRMMGMKIGKNTQLSSLIVGATDLVTLGDNVSIGSGVLLDNACIENHYLKIRSIHIGSHCYIGNSSVISGNTRIEENAELNDLSFIPAAVAIPKDEFWKGSPAAFVKKKEARTEAHIPRVAKKTKIKYAFIFSLLLFTLPLVFITPLLPTIITMNEMHYDLDGINFSYLWFTPIFALSYVLVFLLQTIISSKIFRSKIKTGSYSIYSTTYLAKWLNDQMMNISLNVLHPIYATIFIAPIFRAFGAKVGKKTEISTAGEATHELLSIGEGGFVADAVSLGEADVRDLMLTLKPTEIGNMTFLGNAAVIPQGLKIDSNLLIGVLSTPPSPEEVEASGFRTWVGSPPIGLPRRQESNSFPEQLTINPPLVRKWARGMVEFARVIIPLSVITLFSMLFITFGHQLIVEHSFFYVLVMLPLYYIALVGFPSFLCTALAKWLLVGIYKEKQLPMWTLAVWKSEAITTTYESLAVPYFLEFMEGTLWLPVFLRFLGAKIGKRACMLTTDITEYDMVRIGDDVVFNTDCGPQTHLFEDRVMKIGPVHIGDRCSIGARSIVLYSSKIENDTELYPLSLVMKGETLSGNKKWWGSPVKIHTK